MRSLLLLISAVSLFAFSPPRPKGTITGIVQKDGIPFDNTLILLDETQYRKLDWTSGKLIFENIPSGKYTLKVLIADSLRGNYSFEYTNFDVMPYTLTPLPNIDFSNAKKRPESPIPCVYRHRYYVELIRFGLDDPNIRNVQIEKPFIVFGGYDWQKEIDEIMRDLIAYYVNAPRYNSFIMVEGHATTNEMNGDGARINLLARERARSVVNYIVQNYRIERDRFLIFSRGGSNARNPLDPENGENRRVVISYDMLY